MLIIFIILLSISTCILLSNLSNNDSPLILEPIGIKVNKLSSSIEIEGSIEIRNPHKRFEVMIPEFKVIPVILSETETNNIIVTTSLRPKNIGLTNRKDDYWQAFIIKNHSSAIIDFRLTLEDTKDTNHLKDINSLWIDILWVSYGPFGRKNCRNGFVAPIKFPDLEIELDHNITSTHTSIPIKTHKLGVLDDPVSTIYKYTFEKILPGDIVTIGETPLAIMQGRYIHPSVIETSLLSKALCYFFHPTSSLATACGMQSLINEVGPVRVVLAWLIGSLFKIFKIKGIFYRLAGEQARLVDDITGTTVPYDQVIVLGPKDAKCYCQKLSKKLGAQVAVVDVNDLGKVKILASSKGTDTKLISTALRSNPAGNADEQTPLVIIRPS